MGDTAVNLWGGGGILGYSKFKVQSPGQISIFERDILRVWRLTIGPSPVPVSDQFEHLYTVLYFPFGPCSGPSPGPVKYEYIPLHFASVHSL